MFCSQTFTNHLCIVYWNAVLVLLVIVIFSGFLRRKRSESTNVPRGYARDPKLGNWVHVQHPLYKSKNLNTERMNKLESLGFVWGHSFDAQWTENFLRLVAYKKKHNSTNVPNRYAEDDHPLGNWVTSQRTFYKTKTLYIDRINHLESIGFVWDVYDAQWM